MNKKFFYSVAVVITIFFVACEKDGPKVHECPPMPEDKNIATVKMGMEAIRLSSESIYGVANELATVKYENGILELVFPAIVPDEYLGEYFWSNSANIIPEGIIISDTQVKVGFLSIIVYNNSGDYIGSFLFSSDMTTNNGWTTSLWYAQYIYADRSFTITGTSKHGLVYDCSFKKGWNIRYYSPLERRKYTTLKPINEDFEWRYEEIGCM